MVQMQLERFAAFSTWSESEYVDDVSGERRRGLRVVGREQHDGGSVFKRRAHLGLRGLPFETRYH